MGKSTIIWNLNSMHQNLCNIGKSPWLSTSHRLHVSVCACVGPCAGLRSPGQLSDTSDVVHTCPHVNMDTHIFFILLQIFIALSIVAGEWPNITLWKFCKTLHKAILCNKFMESPDTWILVCCQSDILCFNTFCKPMLTRE